MTQTSSRIAVLDYGMGNLHSVAKALEHVAPNADVVVTSDAAVVKNADRLVFPGVGAIRDCMAGLRRLGFDELIKQTVQEKPVLGICVGMQALLESSEENGGVECLSLLPGQVRFFGDQLKDADGNLLKVPHMGWNKVHQQSDHPMWHDIAQDSYFYFVHSYYACEPEQQLVAGSCHYHVEFAAALTCKNLFAVQFHPEKSHAEGLQLLRNFTAWSGE